MLKSLWLPSWYPSEADSQNGNFTQRHAIATSDFAKVNVIYVIPFSEKKTEVRQSNNLFEKIVYYKKKNNKLLSRLLSIRRYFLLYKKEIKEYIEENGKPDIVHAHITLRAGILALWTKKKYNIPYVLTEQWTIFTPERKDNFATQNFLFKYYCKKVIKNASLFLPVSNSLGRSVQEMTNLNFPFEKIPNVVSNIFNFEHRKISVSPFKFVHVSSLNNLKNVPGIIRAFSELIKTYPDSELKIIGTNFQSLTHLPKELNIPSDKIIFTGEIPYEQVANNIKQANAFILFSNSETFCCVVAESLCTGIPVISTDLACIQESVNDTNSILVGREDETQLTTAMKKMIENYTDYNQENIAKEAQSKFNYHNIGKQIVDIYEQVLTNNLHQNSASPQQHNL